MTTFYPYPEPTPVRAAQALLKVVDAPEPPFNVLLGSDALRCAREKLGAVSRRNRPLGRGDPLADFPDAA